MVNHCVVFFCSSLLFFSYQVIIYLFLGTSKYYPRQIRPQRLLTQGYFQFLVIHILRAKEIFMLHCGSPVLHQGYKLLASCYIYTYNERSFAFFTLVFFFFFLHCAVICLFWVFSIQVLYVLATQADNLARYQLLYGSCLTLLLSFFYVTYSYWANLLYAVSHTLPNVANIRCDSFTFHVRATTLHFFQD